MNLVSSFLGTNSSRWNDRSRAGPSTLLNFRRNDNKRWIPIAFHVYSRYFFSVIKDVFFYGHDATSSVRAHRLVITSTGELSRKEVNMFAKKVKAPQENSASALKKPLILFARSPFPFLVPVISYCFLFLVFFFYLLLHDPHIPFHILPFSFQCTLSLFPSPSYCFSIPWALTFFFAISSPLHLLVRTFTNS